MVLVRVTGLEPVRQRHTHLKRACLPIPAHSHTFHGVCKLLCHENENDYITGKDKCQLDLQKNFLIGGIRSKSHEKLNENPGDHSAKIGAYNNLKAFLFVGAAAKQNQISKTSAGGESGDGSAKGDGSRKEQFYQHHRDGAAGDQANEGGDERL